MRRLQDAPRFLLTAALVLAAALVTAVQSKLRRFLYFGDEGETVVTAKMMAAGDRLYSQIFNHHGPLTFLPQYLAELVGFGGLVHGRAVIACLQWVALLAIFLSPMLRDWLSRAVCTVLAATVMVVFLPDMLGHTMQYHVLAGLLLIVILAQYTFPAVAGMRLSARRVVSGSVLITSLPFLAVTYGPLALLLWLASTRREHLRVAFASGCAAVAAYLGFLAAIGSLPGYWATHFYLNSEILQKYVGAPSAVDMVKDAVGALLLPSWPFIALCIALLGAAKLAAREGGRMPWRTALVGAALVSTLLRGFGQGGLFALPIAYAALTVPVLLLSNNLVLGRAPAVATIALAMCIVRLGVAAHWEAGKHAAAPLPLQTPLGELAKAITEPGDRIIAYSFTPHEYLAADRLPASAQFFYLPWQADYEKRPVLGVDLNACRDIEQNRPKFIYLDRWKVFDSYPWAQYGQCVEAIVSHEYVAVPGMAGAYARKDIHLPAQYAKD